MTLPPSARTLRIVAAFAAIYLVWGSHYLAIKILVDGLPPFFAAAIRCLVAGAVLFAWGISRGIPRPSRTEWMNGFAAGGLMFLVGHGALFWASQRIPSGFAAVIIAFIPIWVAVFEARNGARLGASTITGLFIGIVGIAWLHLPAVNANINPLVSVALLFSSAAWAASMVWYRGHRRPRSAVAAAALPLLGGGVLLLAASLAFEAPWRVVPADFTPATIGSLAYMTLLGSVVTFSAFAWLIDVVSPTAVASYAFVNPVVALGLGWTVGNEPYTRSALLPILLVLVAVVLVVSAARQPGIARPGARVPG